MSARDQTWVHWPGPGSAACAVGEGRPWDGCPPAGAKTCLRPANLQSRWLGWGPLCLGLRETWLLTRRLQLDIPGWWATLGSLTGSTLASIPLSPTQAPVSLSPLPPQPPGDEECKPEV